MEQIREIDCKAIRNIKRAITVHSKQLEEECGLHIRVGKRKHFGKKGTSYPNSYSILLSFYPYSTCEQCGTRMVASLKGANGKRYCTPTCKAKAFRIRKEHKYETVRQENIVLREENKKLRNGATNGTNA
jgi:hypothetical protein